MKKPAPETEQGASSLLYRNPGAALSRSKLGVCREKDFLILWRAREFRADQSIAMVPRFRDQPQKGPDLTYSMVYCKAHTNVALLFAELIRGEPGKDTVTIPRGQIGSYPNFVFVVDDNSVREFVSKLAAVNGNDD